jgi:hypothetical protein
MSTVYTMTRTPDLLPGTLDLLILRTLRKDALHGWAISERIQQISRDVLQINQRSLYPASIVLSTRAGSRLIGKSRSSAAAPSITTSPRPAAINSRSNRGNGSAWRTPSAA